MGKKALISDFCCQNNLHFETFTFLIVSQLLFMFTTRSRFHSFCIGILSLIEQGITVARDNICDVVKTSWQLLFPSIYIKFKTQI